MKIFNYEVARSAYNMRFYWLPKRLTVWINPPIYRWGYWNFCKININLESW